MGTANAPIDQSAKSRPSSYRVGDRIAIGHPPRSRAQPGHARRHDLVVELRGGDVLPAQPERSAYRASGNCGVVGHQVSPGVSVMGRSDFGGYSTSRGIVIPGRVCLVGATPSSLTSAMRGEWAAAAERSRRVPQVDANWLAPGIDTSGHPLNTTTTRCPLR